MNKRKSKEIRREARETLSGNWGRGVGAVAILYGFAVLVRLLTTFIPIIGWLSVVFITYPIMFGFIYVFMNFKNEDSNVSNIFKFFTGGYWRSIGTSIIFGIGASITAIPTAVLMVIGFVSLLGGEGGVGGVLILIAIICLILPIIYGYILAMTFYISVDQRDVGIWESFKMSARLMKGNMWRLFRLQITFIWWGLLSSLTLGIGLLWLMPYMQTSQVIFYREVLAEYKSKNTAYTGSASNTVNILNMNK